MVKKVSKEYFYGATRQGALSMSLSRSSGTSNKTVWTSRSDHPPAQVKLARV